MQISSSRHGRRLVAFTCSAVAVAAAPAGAQAAPAVSDLRVEAGGVVVTNSSFPADTQSFATDTSRPACGGSGQTKTVTGPTALGLLIGGSTVDADLRPVRISDKFSFGLLVCGIGSYPASDSAFWLYKVDHVAPEVGSDAFNLKGGEEVLFYLQDVAVGRNTGDELVVEAPARARPGEVDVTVSAYSSGGARRPAAGARVFFGDDSVTADAGGRARIRLTESRPVRAGGSGDIPSAPVRVCVAEELDECPAARGRRIYGSDEGDRLAGTPGADVIRSGAGNDSINVRGGEDDRVRCGSGPRDRVRLSGGDRATTDCEIVNGRRRSARGR